MLEYEWEVDKMGLYVMGKKGDSDNNSRRKALDG